MEFMDQGGDADDFEDLDAPPPSDNLGDASFEGRGAARGGGGGGFGSGERGSGGGGSGGGESRTLNPQLEP